MSEHVHTNSCRFLRDRIHAYVESELDRATAAFLRTHLRECAECRELKEIFEAERLEIIEALIDAPAPRLDFAAAVTRALAAGSETPPAPLEHVGESRRPALAARTGTARAARDRVTTRLRQLSSVAALLLFSGLIVALATMTGLREDEAAWSGGGDELASWRADRKAAFESRRAARSSKARPVRGPQAELVSVPLDPRSSGDEGESLTDATRRGSTRGGDVIQVTTEARDTVNSLRESDGHREDAADINVDMVELSDLIFTLPGDVPCHGDVNGSGEVDTADLSDVVACHFSLESLSSDFLLDPRDCDSEGPCS